jgi:hypothetical protein
MENHREWGMVNFKGDPMTKPVVRSTELKRMMLWAVGREDRSNSEGTWDRIVDAGVRSNRQQMRIPGSRCEIKENLAYFLVLHMKSRWMAKGLWGLGHSLRRREHWSSSPPPFPPRNRDYAKTRNQRTWGQLHRWANQLVGSQPSARASTVRNSIGWVLCGHHLEILSYFTFMCVLCVCAEETGSSACPLFPAPFPQFPMPRSTELGQTQSTWIPVTLNEHIHCIRGEQTAPKSHRLSACS